MRWRKRAELTETRHSPLTIAALISQITSCVLDIISGSAQSRFILREALTLVKMLTFVRAPPVTPLSTPTNKKKHTVGGGTMLHESILKEILYKECVARIRD